jgi:hypothetical protein
MLFLGSRVRPVFKITFLLIIYLPVTGTYGIMQPDGTGPVPDYRTITLYSRLLKPVI